jgi:hypothetical protein
VGIWQGAIRERDDPGFEVVSAAVASREAFGVELLYTDQMGGQRTVSYFFVRPADETEWRVGVGRHWYLDMPGPRPDR